MKKILNIAEDFTKFTGLRYKRLTPGASGEEFRDEFIIPNLEENEEIIIVFDGNVGEYLPSFLEECFGGLIRNNNLNIEEFNKKIKLVSNDSPNLIDEIKYYVNKESQK